MIRLFSQAAQKCAYVSRLKFMDAEIVLRSESEVLKNCFEDCMDGGQRAKPAGRLRAVNCLLAYQRPDWRFEEFQYLSRHREVFQPEFGTIRIWLRESYAILVVEGLGLVAVHPESGFLCLVHPPGVNCPSNHMPNLPFLVNIILSEILSQSGRLLIHAAGAARDGRCVIWVGPSGAGKTTQVLRMVAEGWDFFGDDQLIVGKAETGDWCVWPVWRNAKVTQDTFRRFPQLRLHATRPLSDGKCSVDVWKAFGISMPEAARLDRINVLAAGGQPERTDLTLQEAFETIAPCLLHYVWAGNAANMIENIFDLVSTRPVHLTSRIRFDDL